MNLTDLEPGHEICPHCGNEIDPETCWCGDDLRKHTYYDGHGGIPMGCGCGFDPPRYASGYPKKAEGNRRNAMNRWDADTDFEDRIIDKVEDGTDYWTISHGGWCFGVPKEPGIEPHVGDTARFYPGGIGHSVRGLLLNGREVFYRTAVEQQEKHHQDNERAAAERKRKFEETGRAKLDADYLTLPSEFKQRIDGFRERKPDFRWEHEGYEMFACTEAVKIAHALKTAEKLEGFNKLTYEQQKMLVPDLSDGHSGNTFGMACRLAHWWLTNPENVVRDHGALCPLVGCTDYGCRQAANQ